MLGDSTINLLQRGATDFDRDLVDRCCVVLAAEQKGNDGGLGDTGGRRQDVNDDEGDHDDSNNSVPTDSSDSDRNGSGSDSEDSDDD